ncbi:MAG: GHKL domain-containing protein, partial [Anaerolineae bacterium]|nr:GHKL domain-containing protein [Anaerolineae bacterium]
GVQPRDAEHIAIVYDHTLHLSRLVDDLRLLTQAETGHLPLYRQSLQPEALVIRAAQLFEPLAQDAAVTLTCHTAPSLPAISGDADRLHQVFANLLANALRHVPSEGTIRLEASLNDGGVLFVVANSGQTLSPDQAEHVFERFWRADEARDRDSGGAGLGLAIAQQIIRLHQGQIWVETTADETRFCVRLPAHSKT